MVVRLRVVVVDFVADYEESKNECDSRTRDSVARSE